MMYSPLPKAIVFSVKCLRQKMLSIHDLPDLKHSVLLNLQPDFLPYSLPTVLYPNVATTFFIAFLVYRACYIYFPFVQDFHLRGMTLNILISHSKAISRAEIFNSIVKPRGPGGPLFSRFLAHLSIHLLLCHVHSPLVVVCNLYLGIGVCFLSGAVQNTFSTSLRQLYL